MMKFLLIPLFALVAFASQARAADQNPPMTYKAQPVATTALPSWTGLYGGIHGGYGVDLTSTTFATGGLTADLAAAPRGPLFGGQLGYDWQPGTDFVFGIRVDADWANMAASSNIANAVQISNATNWLADADLRLGYAGFGNHVLLYVNGGAAVGGAKPNLSLLGTPAVAASQTSTGWNIGGGVETRLTKTVSAFVEADYYSLTNQSLTATIGGVQFATSSTPYTFQVVKGGINLRLP